MTQLKKVLSFRAILLITINSIMGTGIFFLPAVGARHAGPASIISWLILSVVSIYIAMCFAELSSMFPKAGGVYEFCKQAYGRFPSFLFGWMTLVAGNITIAMLIVGAIQYLIPFPVTGLKISICMFFILVFNYMAFKGMKTSAFMLITFSFITVGTLFALIIPGLIRLEPSNLTPFFVFPASAVLVTIFFISETFFGWETATFLAEETKDGAKVMPKALIWGTVIIAVICLLFVVTSLGVMPWQQFGGSTTPLTDLGTRHFGSMGGDVFTILVYLSIIGSVAGWVVSAPRLILALAEDGLFLKQFAKIHKKYYTPYKAIIFQTVLTSILVFIGFGSYETLLHLLVPLVLIMYSGVLLSLVILRYRQPDTTRYYRTPFGKVGPILVVLFLAFLMLMWLLETEGAGHTLMLGLSFIAVGLPIYFLIEMYYDPKIIVEVNDAFAYLALLTERIYLPHSVRRKIIKMLGDIKGKKVLEYGCNVGTLTLWLAREVGPRGKVYAHSYLKYSPRITKRRVDKMGYKHVNVIVDDVPDRVHPSIPKVDVAVSVGELSYIQDVRRVLTQINKRMKKGNRIVFLEYDKFFDIIPNRFWLGNDRKIREVFKGNGFSVHIYRKQGFAWQYIYIYGKKERDA
ncbi:amino acid permease [Candidatus Woesearchaeota archaeon]|nr:amino acid permease [Candidatus Woesearchaeota archaeon]